MKTSALTNVYWLVKREFWEHRGGFFWAPVISGGVMLALSLMGLVTGEILGRHNNLFQFNSHDLIFGGGHLDVDAQSNAAGVLDGLLLWVIALMLVIMAFVVFFYCLGSLYNDRRDRSILFWKSLPVSNRDTVISKVISAIAVAPVIACIVGAITGLLLMLMLAVIASLHGLNAWEILAHVHPLQMVAKVIALIPLYMIWALPTVGWLMLCSAWSRSLPFLWAILLPPASVLVMWWFGLLGLFNSGIVWSWGGAAARLLMSLTPAGWFRDAVAINADTQASAPDTLLDYLGIGYNYAVLAMPDLWIGAIAGIAMIVAATWLRRWRDDG